MAHTKILNMPKNRSSNIELLRIVAMIMIVASHYCYHSGLEELVDPVQLNGNGMLVQALSIGGKTGVNIFFLISGFFMINSIMKWHKVWQLIFQIISINVIVWVFLTLIGYDYSKEAYLRLIPILFGAEDSFITSYLVIYVLSPLINKALHSYTRKEFEYLLAVLLFYFCILASIFLQKTWSYVAWAFTMYSIGAYIRIYHIIESKRKYGLLVVICLLAAWGWVYAFDLLIQAFPSLNKRLWMFAIADANKITLLALAVSIFLWFSSLKIKTNRIINTFSGSVAFGVLLWHDNNNIVRQWLWKDFINTADYFSSNYFWLRSLISIFGVYICCSVMELIRQYLIENPLFSKFNKAKISNRLSTD